MMTWIQTFTGKKFDLLSDDAAQVDVLDIAHALSMIPRFGGHLHTPYSVAQHSCHVCDLVQDTAHKLPALLHDAHEAYIGDIVTPVKSVLGVSDLQLLEVRLARRIASRFGVRYYLDDILAQDVIRAADHAMLVAEFQALNGPPVDDWLKKYGPPAVLGSEFVTWGHQRAQDEFLYRFGRWGGR